MPGTGPLGRSRLVDRRRECGALDRLLGAVHEGGSGVLGIAARRLYAESVAMLVAIREPCAAPQFEGLPELSVEGLADRDARELLEAVTPRGLDARVRDRIVAETRGNPLALLELPRGL